MSSPLSVTLDRIETGWAILLTDDGNEIQVPATILPPETGEGARLFLSITSDPADELVQEQQARNLLQTILGKQK